MPQRSYGGAKYIVTFIDDHSRFVKVECLNAESEAFEAWAQFKANIERQTGHEIKVLRSDNGREYINREFQQHLNSCGIIHETSVPYSPAQNGVARLTLQL